MIQYRTFIYDGFRSLESFLPQALVTHNAWIIPPTQSPKMQSRMLINVLNPHPLSRHTATGGSNKHNTIEQQRLTILTSTTVGNLKSMTHLGVVEKDFSFTSALFQYFLKLERDEAQRSRNIFMG